MDPIVLDRIPFQLELEGLKKKLHVKDKSSLARDLECLVAEAQSLGRPKALYRVSFIESRGDDFITVEGVTLKSRVLRVNLDQAYRIFPYAVTSGTQLDDWTKGMTDLLTSFAADAIKEDILYQAIHHLMEHFRESHHLVQASRMSPGSLADWPIDEQRPLFKILGNTKDLIGVSLNESLMMAPTKSVSGVCFPTEVDFVSCQLCPREACPGRKASYDKNLYERKYCLRKGTRLQP
jgi:hypothetical protein